MTKPLVAEVFTSCRKKPQLFSPFNFKGLRLCRPRPFGTFRLRNEGVTLALADF